MKRIVFLTGAGMSAESGMSTFRDNNGLWDTYNIEDVATPEGWVRNPKLVTDFYNKLRREAIEKEPCMGHRLLVELEKDYNVKIATQNVDNLHEVAGSTNVLHLHGELMKVTSSISPNDPRYIQELTPEHLNIEIGELCEDGSQLRPYIVWFGEAVPNIEVAAEWCSEADIFVIIGTSLNVYPAAGLTQYVPVDTPIFLIDPNPVKWNASRKFTHIQKGASEGMMELCKLLKQ